MIRCDCCYSVTTPGQPIRTVELKDADKKIIGVVRVCHNCDVHDMTVDELRHKKRIRMSISQHVKCPTIRKKKQKGGK